MKRTTITLSDELEAELESYRAGQEVPPSLTSLVQVALRSFLAERRSLRPEAAGGPWLSDIGEAAAVYGEPAAARPSSGSGVWGPPTAPRARDLPALLAGLPRLSESDAKAMARDLDQAREELKEGEIRDPWSHEAASGGSAKRGE